VGPFRQKGQRSYLQNMLRDVISLFPGHLCHRRGCFLPRGVHRLRSRLTPHHDMLHFSNKKRNCRLEEEYPEHLRHLYLAERELLDEEEQEKKKKRFNEPAESDRYSNTQREEALKKYKEKKTATYQLLKRKTKKGQPNLNLHMELLLQKIEAQRK
uniref:Thyroid transcription factor 1-associated protein 26 n=1 Tax=Cyprinus carpio carpio TaxID=630221 RepID=A0A9J7ZEV2_CYPCA